MANRRPAGDGMVRQKKRGQWEGRITVGHKSDGKPIFRYVYGKTQKETLEKLPQSDIITFVKPTTSCPFSGRAFLSAKNRFCCF